jgi:uncharacterized protein YbjT (DUF2867 family)
MHGTSGATKQGAILVTGGAGFVGRSLVKLLVAKGKTVVTMYRNRLPEPLANVYPVCTDLQSVDLLKSPLRGVDCVIHLAWDRSFDEYSHVSRGEEIIPGGNVWHLNHLLKAMKEVGTPRIILVSALGASRQSDSAFLQQKYLAEAAVINAGVPSSLILRPTVVFDGLADWFIKTIANITRYPGVYPVPAWSEELAPIHVDDLCYAIWRGVQEPAAASLTLLDLLGEESIGLDEVFRVVAGRYAKGVKFPIKGRLGDSLLPLFERASREQGPLPKLREFLEVSGSRSPGLDRNDSVVGSSLLPKQRRSFREVLGKF